LERFKRYILVECEYSGDNKKEKVFLIHDIMKNKTITRNDDPNKPLHANLEDFTDDLDIWILNNRHKKLNSLL
jgi:hypothetical protein